MNSPEVIHVAKRLSDKDVARMAGKVFLSARYYDTVISHVPTDVLLPDGSPLLKYRPGYLPQAACDMALPSLRRAAGGLNDHRYNIKSGVIGNLNCRETAFTANEFARYARCLPLVRALNAGFRLYMERRYAVQRLKAADETDRRLVIPKTCFTTITVNRWTPNDPARTPVHVDDGDL